MNRELSFREAVKWVGVVWAGVLLAWLTTWLITLIGVNLVAKSFKADMDRRFPPAMKPRG